MGRNTIVGVLVALLVIIVGVFMINADRQGESALLPDDGARIDFSITDAAADIEGVSEVVLTTGNLEVYSEANGWVKVETKNDSFNLLELKEKNQLQLLATAEVEADTFTQIRLNVEDITVIDNDNKSEKAILASSELLIDTAIRAKEGERAHVTIDFIVDESLHKSTDGKFVFATVVETESRSDANVKVESDDMVIVSGGSVDSTTRVGVGLDGKSRVDFSLDDDVVIKLDASGKIESNSTGNSQVDIDDDSSVIKLNQSSSMKSESDVKVDIDGTEKEAGVNSESSQENDNDVELGL